MLAAGAVACAKSCLPERGKSCSHLPMSFILNFRSARRASLLVLAAVLLGAVAVYHYREPLLRSVGWALVVNETVAPADVIVVSLDSGGAGALEAADLVHGGIASRVAVFMDPPTGEDFEFIRRGLPYEDAGARQVRQLNSLGVNDVTQIARVDGTAGEGQALLEWCRERKPASIVFVATTDHARRTQRVLSRAMKGCPARIIIRPARYSSFDPDRWWESRGGVRTAIVEFQKLLLDIVLNPGSM